MLKFLYKWLWCSWIHKNERCYPTVWSQEQAKLLNIPYKPNYWHCAKCYPCNSVYDSDFLR